MIIDEKHIRDLIRNSLIKEIGFSGIKGSSSSSSSSDSSSDFQEDQKSGEEGTHLNFKYVSIPNEQAAKKAESEMAMWGGKKENDPNVKAKLTDYWSNIKDIFKQDPDVSISKREPWSAAFISYVMNDPFFRSSAHITWKNKAEKNTLAVKANPASFAGKETYILLPIDDKVKLERGDNVWAPREGGPNKSHSDVVISPTEVIGGNVSDTVGKKKVNHPFVIKKVKIIGPVENSKDASGEAAKKSSVA